MDGSDPVSNYQTIRSELVQYQPRLGARPEIPVVSKAELPGSKEVAERLRDEADVEPLLVSAVTGLGLNQLTGAIAAQLNEQAD